MKNLQQTLNDEIRRLARKEIKLLKTEMHKQITAMKKQIADMKNVAKAEKAKNNAKVTPVMPDEENTVKNRISAKGIQKLRNKLGISQAKFGALIGVGALCVGNWEAGKTHPRQAQTQRLAVLRKMGKREVARMLGAMNDGNGNAGTDNAEKPAKTARAKKAGKAPKADKQKAPKSKIAAKKPGKKPQRKAARKTAENANA